MGVFFKSLTHEQADLVEIYKGRLTIYDFSCITIKEYPIEIATEVFSRINTGGKTLTVFEIMVAKTYDEAGTLILLRNLNLSATVKMTKQGSSVSEPQNLKPCLSG